MIETLIAFTLLINAERAVDLKPDILLTIRAHERAEQLCATNQWSHEGWMKSFEGLSYTYAGENLAKDFPSAHKAHEALMASKTHKDNILNPFYSKVGVAKGGCGIYVELFSN